MRKIILLFILIILLKTPAFAAVDDMGTYYNNTQQSTIKLLHDVDPFQDEEYYKYAWSPYPLFRTSSPLYFKDTTIPPGYYLITARNFKGNDYVLFKDNGKVKFIIPVVKKVSVSPMFYQRSVPTPKLTKWQKTRKKMKDWFFSKNKNSKKVPPPNSFIDIADDGVYLLIKYYFGNDCYWLVFKKNKY